MPRILQQVHNQKMQQGAQATQTLATFQIKQKTLDKRVKAKKNTVSWINPSTKETTNKLSLAATKCTTLLLSRDTR